MVSRLNKVGIEPVCTLREVADELGVTVERARQIEAKALNKLRYLCIRQRITPKDLRE